jgi:hypothetical protein
LIGEHVPHVSLHSSQRVIPRSSTTVSRTILIVLSLYIYQPEMTRWHVALFLAALLAAGSPIGPPRSLLGHNSILSNNIIQFQICAFCAASLASEPDVPAPGASGSQVRYETVSLTTHVDLSVQRKSFIMNHFEI